MEEITGALACSVDQKAQIIKELAHGFELAKQLRTRMLITSSNPTFSEDDQALNYSLLDKMLSSFDKSISLARLFNFTEFHSESSSTRSSAFGRPSNNEPSSSSLDRPRSRKRKKVPNRIEWVQVKRSRTSNGLGGPLDDGFSWRKYGQKDILGAKFPRGYYRCTYRLSQSCAATKQVQRSDADPSMYQVIYKGEHTCTTAAHVAQAQKKPNLAQIKTEPLPGQQSDPLPAQQQQQQECQIPQSNQQEFNLGQDPLEGPMDQPQEREDEAQIFRAFSFNSAHLEPGLIDDDYNFLVSSCDFASFGQFDFPINQLPEIDPNFSVDVAPLLCNI